MKSSRGWQLVEMTMKPSTSSKAGPSPGDDDDSSSSSSLLYDSDADKEFLPGESSSTDSEEPSCRPSKPSKKRVISKIGINPRDKQAENEISGRPSVEYNIPILHNDLYLSADSCGSDSDALAANNQERERPLGNNQNRLDKTVRKIKNKSSIKHPGRKRVRHEKEWLCNIRKRKLAKGEQYVNKKGKVVPEKILKPPCSCRLKCFERISQDEKKQIFSCYWCEDSNNDMKRQFISSCIQIEPTARSRKRNLESNRSKENTLFYYFMVNNNKVRVCKTFFLNTLSISNKVVVNILRNMQQGGIVKLDGRGKQSPKNKTPMTTIENVKAHISSFPAYDSHYSRERTSKKYLGPELNVEKMYNLYLECCKEKNIDKCDIAEKWVYRNVFNTQFDLSFKSLDVDTCDTCDGFLAQLKGDMDHTEKELIKQAYDEHLKESENRYKLKAADTKIAKEFSTVKVLTGDLQKCLPTPLISNCLSFYKRKLWTLNFTLFDSSDSSVYCMMWDETKAARGGNEMASALLKWAEAVIPGSAVEHIILWTDNCYGQNKNKSMIMCFYWILKRCPQIKTINQKFLLKGHTHMEADTVHALIERKRKSTPHMSILTPWDWQQLVRHTSKKYKVFNMELDDLKKFDSLMSGKGSPFISRKFDVSKTPVLFSNCVQFEVRGEDIGQLFIKTAYEDEFTQVDLVRSRRAQSLPWPTNVPTVTSQRLPINSNKYSDLLSLLPYLPSVCHDFFRNLPNTTAAAEYPRGDEDETED